MDTITNLGETMIAQSVSGNTPLNLTRFVLANISGLDPTQPANPNQVTPGQAQVVHVAPVHAKGFVSTDKVIYSLHLDTKVGDFEYNWLGLTDDNFQLFYVAESELIKKFKTQGTQQGDNITTNVLIQFSNAQTTTGVDVPAEFWQVDYSQTFQRIWRIAENGYKAINGDHLIPNNMNVAPAISLPDNPSNATVVTIRPGDGDYLVRPVTVRRNGKTIGGFDEDVIITDSVYLYEFRFSTELDTWKISRTGLEASV